MVIIVYDDIGTAISDFLLEKEFKDIVEASKPGFADVECHYSTENIFERVMYGIANGEISHENVQFRFNGDAILLNRYGVPKIWPAGFIDRSLHFAEERLRLQAERYKKEKESKQS